MKRLNISRIAISLLMVILCTLAASAQTKPVKKVLFIGDSQTGWMGERLTAYGAENGFEVATITWDGATPQKYAKSGKLPSLIAQHKPDVVFINLGMNELLERNPQASLGSSMATIKKALGDIPFVWVGPLSWPGKGKGETLVNWLRQSVESVPNGHFYYASDEVIPRQSKTNPHPTRDGAALLVDHIVSWLPSTDLNFTSLKKPSGAQMKRGKTFIYRRMNQSL
ncbi:MAG: SGNH/GDSL hydrolase family protein [Prevotella sp.]|nr:SGNH/GDSL hydrolase family protein [Prevotella sp.]MCM1075202.1 SGNH/GDSL hydrolase family protein [Ruminococcus sp.]